ncbi:MAG: TIGR03936 family radical SAM-associated protein [Oscillospiraceae bacterium]|nr:TIGR03936 family radical SAM-associated protein [Oscillospiraceae bacterium]
MIKSRLLFRKEGRAQYISHLDLMHTMQRTFIRAGVRIRHTEGFNPHPYMSFILPLSVGCESRCELMDFDLDDAFDPDAVPALLNAAAPEGLTAVRVYPRTRKGAELKWLRVEGILEYDSGVPRDACRSLGERFGLGGVVVRKRTKKGETELDLTQNMRELAFSPAGEHALRLEAVLSAQQPSVNPGALTEAVGIYLPKLRPNFAHFTRLEVYDAEMRVFR